MRQSLNLNVSAQRLLLPNIRNHACFKSQLYQEHAILGCTQLFTPKKHNDSLFHSFCPSPISVLRLRRQFGLILRQPAHYNTLQPAGIGLPGAAKAKGTTLTGCFTNESQLRPTVYHDVPFNWRFPN